VASFFTSDTHFHHRAQAERRGFATVEDMNECIVRDWNARVQPGDTVYHLGDLSFAGYERTEAIVKRLNGHIHIVPGNHDEEKLLNRLSLALSLGPPGTRLSVKPPLMDLKLSRPMPDGTSDVDRFTLCHFPLLVWNRSHYGAMHLHGHSHGNLRYPESGSFVGARIMDVGVDTHSSSWGPYSLDQVREYMKDRGHVAHDHHKERDPG
jgi:calcineurin-like phosphoesterase family protein